MKLKLTILLLSFIHVGQLMAGMGMGNTCDSPNPPPGCPVIPIDNHLIWLFVVGIGLVGFQFYKIYKSKSEA